MATFGIGPTHHSTGPAQKAAQRVGLSLEFTNEIDRCVSLASKQPLQFAVIREDIRRVVANHFHSVYFRTEKHRIVVLAVLHSRRDPAIRLNRA